MADTLSCESLIEAFYRDLEQAPADTHAPLTGYAQLVRAKMRRRKMGTVCIQAQDGTWYCACGKPESHAV